MSNPAFIATIGVVAPVVRQVSTRFEAQLQHSRFARLEDEARSEYCRLGTLASALLWRKAADERRQAACEWQHHDEDSNVAYGECCTAAARLEQAQDTVAYMTAQVTA